MCESISSPESSTAGIAGPALKKGMTIKPRLMFTHGTDTLYFVGAHVFCGDTEVFSVNETGRQLLEMADGTVTLDEMITKLGLEKTAPDVGLFFVTLGQSGYLENKIEIMLYETRSE